MDVITFQDMQERFGDMLGPNLAAAAHRGHIVYGRGFLHMQERFGDMLGPNLAAAAHRGHIVYGRGFLQILIDDIRDDDFNMIYMIAEKLEEIKQLLGPARAPAGNAMSWADFERLVKTYVPGEDVPIMIVSPAGVCYSAIRFYAEATGPDVLN